VLLVLLYHAGLATFSGGYIGVDVFFVISGYLITGLLVREVERTGRIQFAAFYARRMRRLLPAAIVVIVATALLARLLLSPLEQREFAPSVAYSALYVSNISFAAEATNYLGGDLNSNPLLHTWSLSAEEQFYLVWPALLFAVGRGNPNTYRRRLALTLGAVLVTSFAAGAWITTISQPWAFFASPLRSWEFAAGGLTFLYAGRFASRAGAWGDLVAVAGLVTITAAAVLFDGTTRFPGVSAALPVAGTVMAILGGRPSGRSRLAPLLAAQPVQLIGDISYSLYLWHWPLLVFAVAVFPQLDQTGRLVCVALSFPLAWLTQLLVENPVRFNPVLAAGPVRSIALGICLTFLGCVSGVALKAAAEPPGLDQSGGRGRLPRIYEDGCHLAGSTVPPGPCVYGDLNATRTMALFGDSHAAQWFPAFERIALTHHWRLVTVTRSGCAPAPVAEQPAATLSACARWQLEAIRRIAAERVDVVIISNWSGYLGERGLPPSQWLTGRRSVLEALRQTGNTVILLQDNPQPGFDMPICVSRARWQQRSTAACDFRAPGARDPLATRLDDEVAAALPQVRSVETSSLLCQDGICPAVINGQTAYRDRHHLTAETAAHLAEGLWSLMTPAIGE
jgi:peptidoglycan/LPS O-acetylase OafA/YrhL